MLIIEGVIILVGLIIILILFVKNAYYKGIPFAKSQAKMQYSVVTMVAKTFIQVFVLGRKESEIIDD